MRVERLDLQLFAEGGEGDGTGGAGSGQGGGTGGAGGQTGQQGGGASQPFAVFQDEKSFMSRVAREAKGQLAEKAKALGFDSVEAMEAAVKTAKERTEAEKTELQKAQEKITQAEAERQKTLASANDRLLRAEFKALAAQKGFANPDDAYLLAGKTGVEVKDDGTVTGVAEAVEALLKARPYLAGKAGASVGSGTNPGSGNGNTAPTYTRAQIQGMSPEEIDKNWPAISAQMAAGTLK